MLEAAPRLSLRDLRRRGDRISDTFAPPGAVDAHEQDLITSREKRAWAATQFWMRDQGDGTYTGRFTLPELQGEMLKTIIEALTAPRHTHTNTGPGPGSGSGSALPASSAYPNLAGRAFATLIEHAPTQELAHTGGTPAVLAISLSYEKLTGQVTGCASTTTGLRLSPAQARRLACTAQILPQVFNGRSLPLDHGTMKRLFTKHQRIALAQRDHGCAAPACDRPPAWCEAHHGGDPWSHGGPTNLDQGVLLCPFHHHQVHDGTWTLRFHPHDGTPEFQHPGHTTWHRNTRYHPPRDLGVAEQAPHGPSRTTADSARGDSDARGDDDARGDHGP